jgi:hypothetical protein
MKVQTQSHPCRFGEVYRYQTAPAIAFLARDPKKPKDETLYPFWATGQDMQALKQAWQKSRPHPTGSLEDRLQPILELHDQLARKAEPTNTSLFSIITKPLFSAWHKLRGSS